MSEVAASYERQPAPASQLPRRILVVDDVPLFREVEALYLARLGDVRSASSAAEARELLARESFDVAVVDLTMPRLSGLEAVRRIHQELPQVRVLALTVHEEEEYVLPVVRAGASGYLVKDSAVAELLAAVRALRAGQGYFGPQAARVLAEQCRQPMPIRIAGRPSLCRC